MKANCFCLSCDSTRCSVHHACSSCQLTGKQARQQAPNICSHSHFFQCLSSLLLRGVITTRHVANFHNVIEIWEAGKQVAWLSAWLEENWNGAHSYHRVLLNSFLFGCSGLWRITMTCPRFIKHKTHTCMFKKKTTKCRQWHSVNVRIWLKFLHIQQQEERKQDNIKIKGTIELVWFAVFRLNLHLASYATSKRHHKQWKMSSVMPTE